MSAIVSSRIVSDIDPFSPEFRADPFTHYARLRALGPVVWLERYGIWVVSHYETVRAVLQDWRIYSNAGGGGLTNYFKTPPWRQPSLILEVDPPAHERTRTVLMRALSTPAVRGMRPEFERVAQELVRHALERGRFDAIPELVQPFPLTVFPDAVGLAKEERETLLIYGAMVFGGFGPSTPWYEDLMQRAPEVSAWIMRHCRRDALAPGGLGASLYQAADNGELTEDEALLLVRSLLSAGVDTTIDSIGLALRCLAENLDQWRVLREDPRLARAAFEEATRYDSSSQSLFRTTLDEVELAGTLLGKHEKVLVLIGSAGRDPAQWPEADRFDIRRQLVGQIGYGAGIHGCVAQMMARLEGEVFLQTVATLVKDIESDGPSRLRLEPGLRGLSSLPLAMRA
jgi:cytochrome P450